MSETASSWKEFKQRQLVTQCSSGSDLAARRCVGVITAAINIAEPCEELGVRRGRQEPSLVVFVCLSQGEQEGYEMSYCEVQPCSWRQRRTLSVLSLAFPAGCTGRGWPLRCRFGDGQWPGLILISLPVSTCISTLVQWQWKQSGLLFPKLKE